MKITEDMRKYAAEQGIAEEEALKRGSKKDPASLSRKAANLRERVAR
jgi:hypothetical protein